MKSLTHFNRKHLIVITTAVVLGAAWWTFAQAQDAAKDAAKDGKAPAATAKPALTVTTTKPAQSEWPTVLAANGNIAPWQEAVIGAEASGLRLTEVLVNVGDRVKRGQLLARLQSDTINADMAQTRASIAENEAMLAEAQANAERARQLQATGAISAQQIAQYLTAEQTARARLNAMQAKLKSDQVRLSQTRIVASDEGVISARMATVGAVVQPGQELFKLIRKEKLEWRAEVTASELARIKPGATASINPPGGQPIKGTVRMIAPTVDAQTRNGLVYVDLPVGAAAKAGMYARGEFALGSITALTIPAQAVVLRDGFTYVFRLDAGNVVRQAKVVTGRRNGDRVEITDGLKPEHQVVTAGAAFLADGDTVRIASGDAASKTAAAQAPVAK